jgi:hypothetical protein
MIRTSIVHADHTYNSWLQSLDIYQQEINVLRRHLGEIVGKGPTPEIAKRAQQYESRFKREETNIELLQQRINDAITIMEERAELDGEWYIADKLSDQYQQLSSDFTAAERVVNKLKHDFQQFSAALK